VMRGHIPSASQERAACEDCHQLAPSHPDLLLGRDIHSRTGGTLPN
jgi:hypothetical protein